MAKMTVNDFIKRATDILNSNTVYAMGMFGQTINQNNVKSKKNQYPKWYTGKDFTSYYGKGYKGYDCVCYVKAVLWGGTPTKLASYASNGVPDIDTEEMYNVCTNKCKPTEAKKGYLLHMYNHVGIALGDGYVLECSNGKVRKTPLNYQKWTGAGKLPYVDYNESTPTKKDDTIKCGDVVCISTNAIYGGLSNARGLKVPKWVCEGSYEVQQIANHYGEKECLLKGIYSWVSEKYLTKKR